MRINSEHITASIEKRPRDGIGEIYSKKILDSIAFGNKLNGFFYNKLNKNSEIGIHTHIDNIEVYFIISGKGKYYDNKKWINCKSGDLLLCEKGQSHALKTIDGLEFIAFIVI